MRGLLPIALSAATLALATVWLLCLASGTAEAAEHGVDLKLSDPTATKTLDAPHPVRFNLTVEHTGEALTEWVVVSVLNESSTWGHTLTVTTNHGPSASEGDLRFVLDRGETALMALSVEADPASSARTYALTVKAEVEVPIPVEDALEVVVRVPQFAAVALGTVNVPVGGEFTGRPPSDVVIDFDLWNTGNGPDRFLLEATSSLAASGWTVAINKGTDALRRTPTLPSDPGMASPLRVQVTVHIPSGASTGDVCTVTLSATSLFDPSVEGEPATARVRPLKVHSFSVEVVGLVKKVGEPGDWVTFRLLVTNLGNSEDDFWIYPDFDAEAAPDFTARVDPDRLTLPSGGNGTVDYVVSVPKGALAGDFTFNAEVRTSSQTDLPIVRAVVVTVRQVHLLSLGSPAPSLEATLGTTLVYYIHLRNDGNGLDSVVVEVGDVPEGWPHYVQPFSLNLASGETATVEVTVIVPLLLDGAAEPTYEMTLWANSSRASAQTRLPLELVLEPFARLEWVHGNETVTSPSSPDAESGTITPRPVIDQFTETSTQVMLRLWNMGNVDDDVTIDAPVEDAGVTVDVFPLKAKLDDGQLTDVTVTISVEDGVRPGAHSVWLRATSSDRDLTPRRVPLEFDVVPVYSAVDFVGLHSGDPLEDDFTYEYATDGPTGPVTDRSGRRGLDPALDIISVEATIDIGTSTVTLAIELKGLASRDGGVRYEVCVVTPGHQLWGPLLDPEDGHERGAFTWDSVDGAHVLFRAWTDGGRTGSSYAARSLEVEVLGDQVYFHVGVRDLRRAGVEPGSGFRLYAYCHRLGSGGETDPGGHITYDTAGEGAAPAPLDFGDLPGEASSGPWLAVGLAVAVALVLGFAMLWRMRSKRPPEDEFDPEQWEEYT